MYSSRKTTLLNYFRNISKIDFVEKYLRRHTINKHSNSFIAKLVANNYQYKRNTIRKFRYNDIDFIVDIYDYVGHYLYFGFLDIGQEKLISLIKPNDVILDIGTNIGSTILQMAKTIGNDGFVYGFEPDIDNFHKCYENINLNKFNNLSVENIGLGSENGKFYLSIDCDSNRGCNRITTKEGDNARIVNVVSLDNWVSTKNINKIDVIKLDVEGYEMNVLKGGINVIKKLHPILFIELDDNNLRQQNSSSNELVDFLMQLDYVITHAETNEQITNEYNFLNTHFDIICRQS